MKSFEEEVGIALDNVLSDGWLIDEIITNELKASTKTEEFKQKLQSAIRKQLDKDLPQIIESFIEERLL